MNRKAFLGSIAGALFVPKWLRPETAVDGLAADGMWIERFLFSNSSGEYYLAFQRPDRSIRRRWTGRKFRIRHGTMGAFGYVVIPEGESTTESVYTLVAPHYGLMEAIRYQEYKDSWSFAAAYLIGAWDVAYNKALAGA